MNRNKKKDKYPKSFKSKKLKDKISNNTKRKIKLKPLKQKQLKYTLKHKSHVNNTLNASNITSNMLYSINDINTIKEYKRRQKIYVDNLRYIDKKLINIWTISSDPFNGYLRKTLSVTDIKTNYPLVKQLIETFGSMKAVIDRLTEIIHNAPKNQKEIYMFRLTKPNQYEFIQNKSKTNFISYTLTPFGSSDTQDMVSVKWFHIWNNCCLSVVYLPRNSSSLLIPTDISCCAVSEILIPPCSSFYDGMDLGNKKYTYVPIVSHFELNDHKSSNLIPSFTLNRWNVIKNSTDKMKKLYKYNNNIELNIFTVKYKIKTPTDTLNKCIS